MRVNINSTSFKSIYQNWYNNKNNSLLYVLQYGAEAHWLGNCDIESSSLEGADFTSFYWDGDRVDMEDMWINAQADTNWTVVRIG